MNLGLNNYNNLRYKKQDYGNNNLSFKGKTLQYSAGDFEKIVHNVDNVLGNDKFFSARLNSAGIKPEKGMVTIKDEGLFEGIYKTIKYPFVDMPLDIANWALRGLQKTPLKNGAEKLSQNSLLQKRATTVEQQKSYRLVQDLLTEYFPNSESIEKNTGAFKNKVTSGITQTVKNYESRDERTLNRMATSTVSAIYSGRDFYNISMLQKDDSEEAKKAEKSRFKQEMTRMLFSAGMTFVTLGALDKYVKKNIVANSLVIALSALVSEVGSRLLSHTPLRPLTPEQAAKIAQKKNNEKPQKQEVEAPKPNTTQLNFKGNQKEIFSQFASADGSFASLNAIKNEEIKPQASESKKSSSTLKKVALAAAASSGVYLLSKGVKGEFAAKIAKRNLYNANQEKISDFINGKTSEIASDITKSISDIANKQSETQNKFNIFDKFKDLLTTKKQTIQLKDLRTNIENLKNSKEGAEISNLLDEYSAHVDKLMEKGDTVDTKVDRFLIPGVYNGVTKIFKTVYQILSAPGAMINGVIDKLFFKNSENAVSKINKMTSQKSSKNYKKEAAELTKLWKKYNKADANNNEKIVEQIKKATRRFETGAETGELANLSRTMVTAISTYFFVNDYTNKVLIESQGRDVDKAKEERNERIAHKLSNFVINGTLMNLFNSVFKVPLNSSLIKATAIAAATETTNEFLVRKSICQPVGRKHSKEEIVKYEEEQLNKKGLMGSWSRLFRKLTGKKTLTQKAGISANDQAKK